MNSPEIFGEDILLPNLDKRMPAKEFSDNSNAIPLQRRDAIRRNNITNEKYQRIKQQVEIEKITQELQRIQNAKRPSTLLGGKLDLRKALGERILTDQLPLKYKYHLHLEPSYTTTEIESESETDFDEPWSKDLKTRPLQKIVDPQEDEVSSASSVPYQKELKPKRRSKRGSPPLTSKFDADEISVPSSADTEEAYKNALKPKCSRLARWFSCFSCCCKNNKPKKSKKIKVTSKDYTPAPNKNPSAAIKSDDIEAPIRPSTSQVQQNCVRPQPVQQKTEAGVHNTDTVHIPLKSVSKPTNEQPTYIEVNNQPIYDDVKYEPSPNDDNTNKITSEFLNDQQKISAILANEPLTKRPPTSSPLTKKTTPPKPTKIPSPIGKKTSPEHRRKNTSILGGVKDIVQNVTETLEDVYSDQMKSKPVSLVSSLNGARGGDDKLGAAQKDPKPPITEEELKNAQDSARLAIINSGSESIYDMNKKLLCPLCLLPLDRSSSHESHHK